MRQNWTVIWKEGMFLQPQHFQQMQRQIRQNMYDICTAHSPYWFGVSELEFDCDAIANGMMLLTKCKGVLPDQTPFAIPLQDVLPAARSFTDHFTHEQQTLDVYLALPLVMEGSPSASAIGIENGTATRYCARTVSVCDDSDGRLHKEIEIGGYNFTLLFGDESRDQYAVLRIAVIARNFCGETVLSQEFIPPLLSIGASPYLQSSLRSLLELLFAKINILSGQRKNIDSGFAGFSGSDENAFRLLYTLNTYTPLVNQYYLWPNEHPYSLFGVLAMLAGALCTFSSEVSIVNLPQYDHGNLSRMFGTLFKIVRDVLETDIQAGCVVIPVEQLSAATFTCRVPNEKLFGAAAFFLGIAADCAEKELVVGALQRIKMCSRNNLDMLISSAMPGLQLRHVIHPPQGLSTKPGFVYFSFDQQCDFWKQMVAAGTIAFYFPHNYKNLRMEILALKE